MLPAEVVVGKEHVLPFAQCPSEEAQSGFDKTRGGERVMLKGSIQLERLHCLP